MSEKPENYRRERIERLLKELRYEVERGMMDGEVDEQLAFTFCVPISKTFREGIVLCKFETRPMPRYAMVMGDLEPRLKVVK